MNKPVTREETYLAAMAGDAVNLPSPVTREEYYLAAGAGMDVNLPEPITRKERFLKRIAEGSGNGEGAVRNQDITVTENGEYTAEDGYTGLGKVTVNVQSSGGSAAIDMLINKTISGIESNVEKVGERALQSCQNLVSARFPEATSVESYAFAACKALKEVCLPKWVKQIGGYGYTFYQCSALEKLDFPQLTTLQSNVFSDCSALKVLVLRSSTMATMTGINAFNKTPFSSGKTGGVLLVPSALAETYKTATNWSVLFGYGTNRFLAIEDYTVDGTVTGEIDWDRVEALFE